MKKNFTFILCTLCLHNADITAGIKQTTTNNRTKIMELSSAYIISRAIHVAAQLKIADYILNGACSIGELAKKTHLNQDSLYRLLRLLASYEIFNEDNDSNFSLTPLSRYLVSTDPDSLWAWISYHHDTNRWLTYGNMEHSIQTGNSAFKHMFNKDFFEYVSESPLLSKQFDEGMQNISVEENAQITQSYDFSPYTTIVDIGGGSGGLITEIIANNKNIYAILFDLPHVQHATQNYCGMYGINNHITFIPSTGFFDPIPRNIDLYLLKRILHDWNDQDCITILKNCHASMHNNSRLLIIDAIVAEKNVHDFKKDIDIEMMVLFGGKERTLQEWITLLSKTELELITTHSTPSLLSIIEVQKKDYEYCNEHFN